MQSMLGGEKTSDSCGSGAGTHFEEREREGDTYANGVPPFFFSSSAFRHHLSLSLSPSSASEVLRTTKKDARGAVVPCVVPFPASDTGIIEKTNA